MRRLALALVLLPAGVAGWLLGPQLAGRALLSLGLPSAAATVFQDAAWKGVALYEAGRWGEAAEAFSGDPASAYDLGNALALAGRYREAIAVYDRALAADPEDEDAAFNKDLLTSLIEDEGGLGSDPIASNSAASRRQQRRSRPEGDTRGSGDGAAGEFESRSAPGERGSSKAAKVGKGDGETAERGRGATGAAGAAEGAGRTGGQQIDVAALLQARDRRIRRRLEARSIQPSREWLDSLPDDPGRFLKLRILAEKARRLRAAGGPIPEDD